MINRIKKWFDNKSNVPGNDEVDDLGNQPIKIQEQFIKSRNRLLWFSSFILLSFLAQVTDPANDQINLALIGIKFNIYLATILTAIASIPVAYNFRYYYERVKVQNSKGFFTVGFQGVSEKLQDYQNSFITWKKKLDDDETIYLRNENLRKFEDISKEMVDDFNIHNRDSFDSIFNPIRKLKSYEADLRREFTLEYYNILSDVKHYNEILEHWQQKLGKDISNNQINENISEIKSAVDDMISELYKYLANINEKITISKDNKLLEKYQDSVISNKMVIAKQFNHYIEEIENQINHIRSSLKMPENKIKRLVDDVRQANKPIKIPYESELIGGIKATKADFKLLHASINKSDKFKFQIIDGLVPSIIYVISIISLFLSWCDLPSYLYSYLNQ